MAEPITKREPLVTRATVTSAVAAIIGLLVAFGVPLAEDQQAAIMGAVAVAAPLVVAAIARSKVTPSDPAA